MEITWTLPTELVDDLFRENFGTRGVIEVVGAEFDELSSSLLIDLEVSEEDWTILQMSDENLANEQLQ